MDLSFENLYPWAGSEKEEPPSIGLPWEGIKELPSGYGMSKEAVTWKYPGETSKLGFNFEDEKEGFWGSLWGSFKGIASSAKSTISDIYQGVRDVAPDAIEAYKQIHEINKPMDQTSLVIQEPVRQSPSSPDQVIYTPYQRESTGVQPAVITTGEGQGLSITMILIVGAAALFFLSKKGR